jgi:hypothetical protein
MSAPNDERGVRRHESVMMTDLDLKEAIHPARGLFGVTGMERMAIFIKYDV